MTDDRIEYSGPLLKDELPVPLDDLTIGMERVLDEWRERVRTIDLQQFEGLVAFTIVDDGEAYSVQRPVLVGKPAAWLVGLSLLLCDVINQTILPSKSRKKLLTLLTAMATAQSDFLDSVKSGLDA